MQDNEGEYMRRIFSGTQRNAIINHDGCCVSCGFIEQGLFATETKDGSFETLCEECLAPKHLETFSDTTFQAAYLPELSGPVVAHFSRVAAWFYFASRIGKNIEMECGFDGLLPAETSRITWWESPLAVQSYKAAKADMKVEVSKIRQMRKGSEAYAFLRNRIDATKARFGAMTFQGLERAVGCDVFARDFRMIPVAIPLSRVRSWSKGSTFSNHPVASKDVVESPSFDDLFNGKTEE
ncbi:hypothetical protein [Rhizobium sp. MHM7A]|uniref:hypothetical protein n=1 Tax=Rhizobium sp. MHM7A TaxID=2583233 RepID=UPI001107523A|nr:hypothetical protein [Rhizobium sp. MHM7A]TLX16189.1 hypothetical protein FFR93_02355 [Rhizobium sp. MHM7A]